MTCKFCAKQLTVWWGRKFLRWDACQIKCARSTLRKRNSNEEKGSISHLIGFHASTLFALNWALEKIKSVVSCPSNLIIRFLFCLLCIASKGRNSYSAVNKKCKVHFCPFLSVHHHFLSFLYLCENENITRIASNLSVRFFLFTLGYRVFLKGEILLQRQKSL